MLQQNGWMINNCLLHNLLQKGVNMKMKNIVRCQRHLHVAIMLVLEVTLLVLTALYVRFDQPVSQVMLCEAFVQASFFLCK